MHSSAFPLFMAQFLRASQGDKPWGYGLNNFKCGHHLLLFHSSTLLSRTNTLFSQKLSEKTAQNHVAQQTWKMWSPSSTCRQVQYAKQRSRGSSSAESCLPVLSCAHLQPLSFCPRKGCPFPESGVLVLGKLWDRGTSCFCPSCEEVPCLCARAFSEPSVPDNWP